MRFSANRFGIFDMQALEPKPRMSRTVGPNAQTGLRRMPGSSRTRSITGADVASQSRSAAAARRSLGQRIRHFRGRSAPKRTFSGWDWPPVIRRHPAFPQYLGPGDEKPESKLTSMRSAAAACLVCVGRGKRLFIILGDSVREPPPQRALQTGDAVPASKPSSPRPSRLAHCGRQKNFVLVEQDSNRADDVRCGLPTVSFIRVVSATKTFTAFSDPRAVEDNTIMLQAVRRSLILYTRT